jgi:hypothetical protein
LARPRGLTRVQSDGSATEPTGVFSLPSREGVKAGRLKADSGRCRVRIVTARGCSSPVSARLTARSTGEYIAGVRKTSFEIPIRSPFPIESSPRQGHLFNVSLPDQDNLYEGSYSSASHLLLI